jgi:hypothetical protein
VDGTAVTSGVGIGQLDGNSFDSSISNGAMPMSGIASGAWSETAPNVFTIHSADGWDVFYCIIAGGYNLSKKTVKLGTDITVTRMVGDDSNPFCGTFDGNGKTLTFNYTSTIGRTAPFKVVKDGCVIENLHVDGTIASTQQYTAGIIGEQGGTVTIRNCRSSVNIQSTMSDAWYINGGHHGGFVAKLTDNATTNLTIEGCVFDGKIVSNGETTTTHCGGFVGYLQHNGSITITNSLYTPQDGINAVDYSATFAYNWSETPTNSYYTQPLGTAQGKAAHTVTAGANVTLGFSGTATEYDVSGITVYDGNQGLKYGSTYYAGENDAVSMTLGHTDREGYEFLGGYTASAGTLNGTTLTMPDADVTITGTWTPADIINMTGNSVVTGEYWSTFYHPEAGYQVPSGTTAYIGKVSGNSMTLTEVTGGFIPAGNAVVLKTTTSDIALTFATTGTAFDFTDNELKGGSTVADGKVAYTLAAKNGTVGFYKFAGAALNPNKAHLEIVPTNAPAYLGFDENTTAINEHEFNESHELSGAWYDLQGRKIANGQKPKAKGLYIVNGKKVIIK